MKNNILTNLLFLALFCGAIYLFGYLTSDEHESLNDHAMLPDLHLSNMKKYANDHEYDRSVFHLEKAIKTIKSLEADVDIHAGEVLEDAIYDLEQLKPEFEHEYINTEEINEIISHTLNALSLAELRVSETYAETNKLDRAKLAMNYALLHLKRSLDFSKGMIRDEELKIYQKLDSLLHDESLISIDVTIEIDDLVHELETMLDES